MKTIDCFGDICPVPVLKADNEIKKMKAGEQFMLITDHSCTVKSVEEKYKNATVAIVIEEVMNGVWEITFTKK